VFSLRPEQIDALARDHREKFVDRVGAHLAQHFPDAAALPWSELRAGVVAQVAKATEYGLEHEHEQATYVTAAWLLGGGFDSRMAAVNATLSSVQLTAEEKREWLEEFTGEVLSRLEKK